MPTTMQEQQLHEYYECYQDGTQEAVSSATTAMTSMQLQLPVIPVISHCMQEMRVVDDRLRNWRPGCNPSTIRALNSAS